MRESLERAKFLYFKWYELNMENELINNDTSS